MKHNNHRLAGYLMAIAVFIADQVSKWFVTHSLALRERGSVMLAPVFDLKWVENYGVSMGFLIADSNAERWLLVVLTGVIALGVLVWIWREKLRGDAIALGFVLGGALGNILDRIRLGHVVDFLDLHFGNWHPFLVFNVADAAITIGVLLLVLRALMTREKKSPAENMNA
jgi:signal peptidase II